MLTKKEKILKQPFIEENYKKHRNKIRSAKPAVDFESPTVHPHVLNKMKKIQKERERIQEIQRENQRLLQKLNQIMSTNRLENYWKEPLPKVYINTPQTKRRARSVPPGKCKKEDRNFAEGSLSKTKSRGIARCPTCSGIPIISAPKIPEERVPFAPPRKTWNQKLLNDKSKVHECCRYCC